MAKTTTAAPPDAPSTHRAPRRVCIVGASGKLGRYMIQHALDRGYILASNITRRVDFALFMLEAIDDDTLIHEAPAIVGCQTPSATAHSGAVPVQAALIASES